MVFGIFNPVAQSAPAQQPQQQSPQQTTPTGADRPAEATTPAEQTGASNKNFSSAGSASEQGSAQQQAAATPPRTSPAGNPTNAQPQSVVTATLAASSQDTSDVSDLERARSSAQYAQSLAKAQELIDSVTTVKTEAGLQDRPNLVDRFAPPDPLPTSPILKGENPTPIKTARP